METRNISNYRIGFVKASWHAETFDQALSGFKSEIAGRAPLIYRSRREKMAKTDRYDAIVCAALVVDGGI